jgi:hypothetical protein
MGGRGGGGEGGGGVRAKGPVRPVSNLLDSKIWTHPSRLWRFVQFWQYSKKSSEQTIAFYEDLWSPMNEDGYERFEEALGIFHTVQVEREIPVLVVIWPWLHQLDEDYPFGHIHQVIAELCAEHNLATLDLLPALRGLEDDVPLWVHESDHHPSAELHRIAAVQITERLKEDPALGVAGWTTSEPTPGVDVAPPGP